MRQTWIALIATVPVMILLIMAMHGVEVNRNVEMTLGIISAIGISITLTMGSAALVKAYVQTRDRVCLYLFMIGGLVQPVFLGLEMASMITGAGIGDVLTPEWLRAHLTLVSATTILMLAVEAVGVVGVVWGNMVLSSPAAEVKDIKSEVVACIRKHGPGTIDDISTVVDGDVRSAIEDLFIEGVVGRNGEGLWELK